MRVILIPVKDPGRAKQRLAGTFTQQERTALAWAMLRDLGQALNEMKEPRRVVIVTSCADIVLFGRRNRWDVLEESEQWSESQSIDWASRQLKASGVKAVLRLPADIPLTTPDDIDTLVSFPLGDRAALIVPSADGTGTNALLRIPPDAFPSQFGLGSFQLHAEEAVRTGTPLTTLSNPRVAIDVDEPGDVQVFLHRASAGFTLELLHSLRASDRIAHART